MSSCCCLSLGGNLGDVPQTFARALDVLAAHPAIQLDQVSRFHRTRPVGPQAGEEYVNAAATLQTSLLPLELLDILQQTERHLGRRREIHWGPRTLDLDLIFYGSEIVVQPRLVVPHPACWYRRFVLDPLVEIAPQVVHPLNQQTVAGLRQQLLGPLSMALAGGTAAIRRELRSRLSPEYPTVEFHDWEPVVDFSRRPVFVVWLGDSSEPAAMDENSSGSRFEDLPSESRLDASSSSESPEVFLRSVLQAALGM